LTTRKRSSPQLFIIESLTREDERAERFEGLILRSILRLSGKESEYFYIRTERELSKIAREFSKSGFRYLHLSCHANRSEMATTYDPIDFVRLGRIFRPHLHGRRVFLSACEMATKVLARELLAGSNCRSVLGPAKGTYFGDAALLWSSFYHLMFRTNPQKMQRKWLEQHAKSTADLFDVALNLFIPASGNAGKVERIPIRPSAD
jgi:hypothetical protein